MEALPPVHLWVTHLPVAGWAALAVLALFVGAVLFRDGLLRAIETVAPGGPAVSPVAPSARFLSVLWQARQDRDAAFEAAAVQLRAPPTFPRRVRDDAHPANQAVVVPCADTDQPGRPNPAVGCHTGTLRRART